MYDGKERFAVRRCRFPQSQKNPPPPQKKTIRNHLLNEWPLTENSQESIHDTTTFLQLHLVMDNLFEYLPNFQNDY